MKRQISSRFASEISSYTEYVNELSLLLREAPSYADADWEQKLKKVLGGQPRERLRQLVETKTLREHGAFFTSSELSRKAVATAQKNRFADALYYDSACGAGDLLLAIARTLPLKKTVVDTVQAWGRNLTGRDIHKEFISACRTRLILLAMSLHRSRDYPADLVDDAFPSIICGDGMKDLSAYENADNVIINPPFCGILAPSCCTWTRGKVSSAALFVDVAVGAMRPGAKLTAILPDVLRSGTRYGLWRSLMKNCSESLVVQRNGLFDKWADVDVFVLNLVKRSRNKSGNADSSIWGCSRKFVPCVGDHFNVHVGPVVPHRDKKKGPLVPYVDTHTLPRWKTTKDIASRRRYAGRTFSGPFVAIRRTSRPGGAYRAAASIVSYKGEVAVENHLLVAIPHAGTLKACKELMANLKTDKTNSWLDRRIRCRHLTVSAVAKIPMEARA
jgi:N-6 DNA Methylase